MSNGTVTAVTGALVALTVIAAATVAVALGKITGEAYVGIVTGFAGFGAGVGAHAAGVQSQPTVTATAGPPPQVQAAP